MCFGRCASEDHLNLVAEDLCFFIESILDIGEFPNCLKQAFVVPIDKYKVILMKLTTTDQSPSLQPHQRSLKRF